MLNDSMILGIAICLSLTVPLLFFTQFMYRGRKRMALNAGVIACALTAMWLYLAALRGSGGPDLGMELWQLYVPVAVYCFFILLALVRLAGKDKTGSN